MNSHLIYFLSHSDFVPDRKIGINFHKVIYCKNEDHVHYDSLKVVKDEEEEFVK